MDTCESRSELAVEADVATATNMAAGNTVESSTLPTAMTLATPKSNSTSPTPNGKLKALQQQLQQQQQQQQQYHQFRTPQQFVKHRVSKKNKTWNKRQNKIGKQNQHQQQQQQQQQLQQQQLQLQQQQQQQHQLQTLSAAATATLLSSVAAAGGGGASAIIETGIAAGNKADLENIQQNVKHQLGSGSGAGSGGGGAYYHQPHSSHHHHHHSHTHHGHYGGAGHRLAGNSGAIVGSITAACGVECRNATSAGGNNGGGVGGSGGNGSNSGGLHVPASLEKLCYGHGHHHLKQQLYKKLVAHRSHYHNHVLCAGAAHNSHGGGAANAGVCCMLHCGHTQNGCKDKDGNGSHSLSNSSVSSAAACNALHYCCGRAKFFLPDKRLRKEIIVPPTKFLLGGNISDPLNLNSLQNETSNNNTPATTPRRSPITTPPKVEVIIPPNIHDPLHLLDPVDSMEYEKQLTSPLKRHPRGPLLLNKPYKTGRNRKNRKTKRRRHDSYGSVEQKLHDPNGSHLATDALSISGDGIKTQSSSNSNNNSGGSSSSANNNTISAEERRVSLSETDCTEWNIVTRSAAAQNNVIAAAAEYVSAHLSSGSIAGEQFAPNIGDGGEYNNTVATRERANRDLRLDLNSTTSTTNSTCGSITGLSSLSSGRSGAGGGRGRKRKISESNNSLKNKKHRDSLDKIVSPVVPQPGAWKRPPRQAASGARKPKRRSTSVSESEILSPVDDANRAWPTEAGDNRCVITPDNSKLDATSETTGVGSPLSTVSGSTSIATAEQETPSETPTEHVAFEPDSGGGSGGGGVVGIASEISIGSANHDAAERRTTKENAAASTAEAATTAAATAADAGAAKSPKASQFRADGQKYCYGNYDRYRGVRQLNEFIDVRLHIFSRNTELFQNKDILDIGCNTGQMTISVARDLAPKSIVGIDIDKDLIKRARHNLAMFVRLPQSAATTETAAAGSNTVIIKKEKQEAALETNTTTTTTTTKAVDSATPSTNPPMSAVKKRKNRKGKKQRFAAAARAASMQPATAAHLMHHHHLLHHHHHHYFHHLNNNWHPEQQSHQQRLHVNTNEFFPISFPLSLGGLDKFNTAPTTPPPTTHCSDTKSPSASRSTPGHPANVCTAGATATTTPANEFPRNVYFRQMNYVLKDESQLCNDAQQYDLILCLSVTKWIHLNFGDAGLKLAFKRMFNQLRPGGKLILEAQNWASYKKKSHLTEEIHKNYRTIEFFPNKFHEYLLSTEVGFSHSYTLGVPRHLNKGFGRPIQLYAKGDYTPNHVRWSDAYYPTTPFEEYRGIYAFMPPRSGACGWNYAKSSTRSQTYDTPHHLSGGASGPYSCRQTPVYHPTYNPLETDSYQPSYDMEYLHHTDVFGSPGSPLYQTVWSPPASLRNSSSHTPMYGSVREAEIDGDGVGGSGGGNYHRHVYPPNDDTFSPNANAGGAFNSIRDPDTDDSAGNVRHVYATNCGESSSSPQVLRPEAEMIDEALMLDEDATSGGGGTGTVGGSGGGVSSSCSGGYVNDS